MLARNAEVLDRAQPMPVADALHGAAILGPAPPCPSGPPARCLRQEARLPHDFLHQLPAAVELGQTGEDVGVDFAAKAEILGPRKGIQQRLFPGQKIVVLGAGVGVRSRPARLISMRKRLK